MYDPFSIFTATTDLHKHMSLTNTDLQLCPNLMALAVVEPSLIKAVIHTVPNIL